MPRWLAPRVEISRHKAAPAAGGLQNGPVLFRAVCRAALYAPKSGSGVPGMIMVRILLRWIIAVFFIVAGANHFRMPAVYLGMMPPWLPAPEAMNVISGAAEILGGIGLLLPVTRRLAGWGLLVLLAAIFPANLHVALQGRMPGLDVSPLTLWLRLPFQAVFMVWVWWVAGLGGKREAGTTGADSCHRP
jgi:uncharacterized membrane protein